MSLLAQLLIPHIAIAGMDFGDVRRKPNFAGKVAVAAALTVMCILVLKQSPGFGGTSVVCANFSPTATGLCLCHLRMSWHCHDSSLRLNFNVIIQVPHGTLICWFHDKKCQ